MAAIFLSYAREDRACAEKLARALETAGHEVWWDRRLDGGEEFSEEIEAALEKSDAVVVAWSKESIKSRWVRDEAGVGGDKGRLVPVSIDGSLPPMGFRQFHTVDLTGWKAAKRDVRTAELLRSVERRLQGKEELPPTSRTAKLPRPARVLGRPSIILAAMLAFLLATAGAYFYLKGDQSSSALKPTIGVLPFTSSDAELRQLGLQARDSLGHTFSQSGVPVRLMDSAPQADRSPVDFLISGDLSRTAGKILATVRLDEAASQVTVFSQRFEVSREDVGNLPERIGAQLAGNLTWAYPMMLLDRRRPIDPALLADLLQGENFAGDRFGLQPYQNLKRVAAKAPSLAAAQIGVAFNTSFVLDQIPRDERPGEVVAARSAADRAIKMSPRFGDTYAVWCNLHSEALLAGCEDSLRAGRRVDPDAPFLNAFLSHLLRSVGRPGEALELARLSYTHDLYVPTKISWMLKMLEYVDEGDEAEELYQQGARWWPEFKGSFFRDRISGVIDRGDFQALPDIERDMDAKKLLPQYAGSAPLVAALKTKSVGAARRACTDEDDYWLSVSCMLVLARLGDEDGAYAIADRLYPQRVGQTPAETERIWLDDPFGAGSLEFITSPSAAPMRRDPRYLQLAQRVGLLDYWRSGRPPDFCRKDPEPICPQLLKRR
ncbi:TIR domain-containing protein [Sphingomonas hankyongi]|uniref:TIR domain-containing protein n=1 Tax=Sphingomonas hankyongi TaxID=2908209 RepID=A0ABT0S1P1_9SPHN|nr:TIR domain-containing protein [Sphingomonas hankyongi]MCL6729774.1 TIR domain-containing protein [Sphingomonas hankyongi]